MSERSAEEVLRLSRFPICRTAPTPISYRECEGFVTLARSPGATGFDWMATVMVACPGSLLGRVIKADKH
jgi:hypothetical protein